MNLRKTSSARVRPVQNTQGMTLLEVMIAAGLMAVALVIIMGCIVSISATSELSEDQAMAAATITSVLEELHSSSFDQVMTYQPPSTTELGASAGVTVTCFDGSGNGYGLPLNPATLTSPLPNPVEVQVTVVWRDKMGRPCTLRGSTFCGR